jgi:hypothetical protein
MILFYTLLVLAGVAIGFLLCYAMVGVKELKRKAELYDASTGNKDVRH